MPAICMRGASALSGWPGDSNMPPTPPSLEAFPFITNPNPHLTLILCTHTVITPLLTVTATVTATVILTLTLTLTLITL